jgi:hypothetical protein
MKEDPSPQTPRAPRRDPVGRLLADMKEYQLQAFIGAEKNITTEILQSMCGSQKRKDTIYICKVPRIKELAARGTTPG